jgi:hypothetical protein
MTPAEGARSTPSLAYAVTTTVGMDFGRLTGGDKLESSDPPGGRALRCDGVISEDQARRRAGVGFNPLGVALPAASRFARPRARSEAMSGILITSMVSVIAFLLSADLEII